MVVPASPWLVMVRTPSTTMRKMKMAITDGINRPVAKPPSEEAGRQKTVAKIRTVIPSFVMASFACGFEFLETWCCEIAIGQSLRQPGLPESTSSIAPVQFRKDQ
jgi:hypothetical protein